MGTSSYPLVLSMEESLEIKDYQEELKDVCSNLCRKFDKCKDKDKVCILKKFVFNLTKREYLRRKKEGTL